MEQLSWKERQEQGARRWSNALLVKWFRIEVKGDYQPGSNSVIIARWTELIDGVLEQKEQQTTEEVL